MGKFKVFLIMFVVLAVVASLWLILKPSFFSQEKKTALPLKNLNETVQAPPEVPQTNPFEEAETNPFKDIKTNPFDI